MWNGEAGSTFSIDGVAGWRVMAVTVKGLPHFGHFKVRPAV
jgi:hypothetical protein